MAEEQKQKNKGPSETIHELYEVSGKSLKRKNKTCPKCGAGHFLAKHKDRLTCGRCGYTEFISKKEESKEDKEKESKDSKKEKK